MKKTHIGLTCLAFVLLFAALFVSCGKSVEFNVTFVVDGENYADVGTTGEESIKMPENPTKEGYTFDGWFWDTDTWEKPFTANSLMDTPLSSDMKVYAKWSKNHIHTTSEWIIDSEATCVAIGTKHKECTECKEVLETATIEKIMLHTEVVDPAIEGTDITDGLTEGKHCSVCGTVLVAQQIVPAHLQGVAIKSTAMTVIGENAYKFANLSHQTSQSQLVAAMIAHCLFYVTPICF